mmetsp:Transcript_28137/g.52772  ORF Transcript_28137/g.52772 Transcript_28137/m.52772 type:complete len:354 (-) Transcript_28137:20-1081(-)
MISPISRSASCELRPNTDTALEVRPELNQGNISQLKEFYLRRLSQSDTAAVSRLRAKSTTFGSPRYSPRTALTEAKREMIMKLSSKVLDNGAHEKQSSTSNFAECTKAVPKHMPELNAKLERLQADLESRILDDGLENKARRHLTQLRHHISTALQWTTDSTGLPSEQTAQQVKQLNSTARVLAPAVYVFSKRAEHCIVQKERALKKASPVVSDTGGYQKFGFSDVPLDLKVPPSRYKAESTVVSELDSECGTMYADTIVTWDAPSTDVGNVQDVNDYWLMKSEDEQRRWFYSLCLSAKMSAKDQVNARKVLISDLYLKARAASLPIGSWATYITEALLPNAEYELQREVSKP